MDFHALTSLDEALEKLADNGSDATLVAGGTSARYLIMSGQITAKAVLHIERLAIGSHGGLSGITLNGGARLGLPSLCESQCGVHRGASPGLSELCVGVPQKSYLQSTLVQN